MNASDHPLTSTRRLPESWDDAFRAFGFAPTASGYGDGGVQCRISTRWLTFLAAALPAPAPFDGSLPRHPGLWTRRAVAPAGGRGDVETVAFDLPVAALGQHDPLARNDRDGDVSLGAYLRWITASARNALPEGWTPPERGCVEGWLPGEGLTLRHGGLLRQGRLILQRDRWALQMPIQPALPIQLPADREAALRELMIETEARWRMVRLGFTEEEGGGFRALMGEVDLSGAPHSPHLLLAGLDALRQSVLWLAEIADLLADVTVTIRSLAVRKQQQDERNRA